MIKRLVFTEGSLEKAQCISSFLRESGQGTLDWFRKKIILFAETVTGNPMGYHMAALLTYQRTASGTEMSFFPTSLDVPTVVFLGIFCLPFVAGYRRAISSSFLKLSSF